MLATHIPQMPVERSARKHYVGILLGYIEAVNPSDAERIEMGIVTQDGLESGKIKPAKYKEEDGRYRLDFWIKGKDEAGKDVRVRHSIYIKDEDAKPATSGNIQVINHQGKTAYIPPAFFTKNQSPYPDWFTAPYRRAKVGEADLVNFINAWINKKTDEKEFAVDFPAICKGSGKSLVAIMNSDKANYIKVMLGVRIADDGRRYQTVFPRVILPAWTINYERLHKELTNYLGNAQSRQEYGLSYDTLYDRKFYRLREIEFDTNSEPVGAQQEYDGKYVGGGVTLPAGVQPPVADLDDSDSLPF